MVAHAWNPGTQDAEAERSLRDQCQLGHRASSRLVRAPCGESLGMRLWGTRDLGTPKLLPNLGSDKDPGSRRLAKRVLKATVSSENKIDVAGCTS